MVIKAVRLLPRTTLRRRTRRANKQAISLSSGSEIAFRTPLVGESEAFVDCVEQSFAIRYSEEQRQQFIAGLDGSLALVGLSQEKIVATLAGHYLAQTVAGTRQVRSLALTDIGVVASARGQGIFRGILDRCLKDASHRGDLVCVLSTEHPDLYRRHGFGRATSGYTQSIAGELRPSPTTGEIVRLTRSEALSVIPEVFATLRARRPGELERPLPLIEELLSPGSASSPEHQVLGLVVDGLVMGYAVFDSPGANVAGSTLLRVLEVSALSIEASHRIWSTLFELGGGAIECVELAGDEPFRDCLVAGKTLGERRSHARTFNRLIDLRAALLSRGYLGDFSLNFVVDDPKLLMNTGTWKITTNASDAPTIERTPETPDIRLSMAMLATLFSGDASIDELVADPDCVVYRDGAERKAIALFGVGSAPYSTSLC